MAEVGENMVARLSKSCIGDAEKIAVMRVLDHEYLGMGSEVQLFEAALTEFFGRPALCVVNGTAALHLALQADGIGAGDEVLVQSLTYVASFQAVSATGATPVACDVDPVTLCLDWKDAERRLTSRIKAVMPVHYAGGVGALDEIYAFARRHGLHVIEDAAHAFGSKHNGMKIGGFGDIACFSFDGIKNITSGEGGCIVTDDQKILQKVRDARLLGVEKDTEQRYKGGRSWDFDATTQGWRYHMSNIMAAIGIEQLKRFPEFSEKRQNIAKLYDSLFSDHHKIQPIARDYDTVVPHIYVVRIVGMKNRNVIQQKMKARDIQIGYHYQPNHWLSRFKDDKQDPLVVTDAVYPELISLPLHTDVAETDIEYVATELIKLVEKQDV